MNLHFYIANKGIEIIPQKSQTNLAEHYAWCLREAIEDLLTAIDDEEKQDALNKFAFDMKRSAIAKGPFKKIEIIFNAMINTYPLPDTEYLISFISELMNFETGKIEIELWV